MVKLYQHARKKKRRNFYVNTSKVTAQTDTWIERQTHRQTHTLRKHCVPAYTGDKKNNNTVLTVRQMYLYVGRLETCIGTDSLCWPPRRCKYKLSSSLSLDHLHPSCKPDEPGESGYHHISDLSWQPVWICARLSSCQGWSEWNNSRYPGVDHLVEQRAVRWPSRLYTCEQNNSLEVSPRLQCTGQNWPIDWGAVF